RLKNDKGEWIGSDAIGLTTEGSFEIMEHPFEAYKSMRITNLQKEALLQPVMEKGERSFATKTLQEIADYREKRFAQLPTEYKRFNNPHHYKVGISEQLKEERNRLIELHKSL
ncbi:MAG: nicotinate phosphoribosyltransferase, partial [Mesonia sp.]